jgi:hypothetical protein
MDLLGYHFGLTEMNGRRIMKTLPTQQQQKTL